MSDVRDLADHLLADENELATIVSARGIVSRDLLGMLKEMRGVSLGTRTRKCLYHASINVPPDEQHMMTRRRWMAAVAELEKHMKLQGHQRAVIEHVKNGRRHLHVVWGRVHPLTLKTASDSRSYARHERCSRVLEKRWGLKHTEGVHSRTPGSPRPVAQATHKDWQAAQRTGVAVQDVANRLQRCWQASQSGRQFQEMLQHEGITLAAGRRGIVAVDWMGTPHSIPRRLRLKAAEVHAKLADLDEAALPLVSDAKTEPTQPQKNKRRKCMSKTTKPIAWMEPQAPTHDTPEWEKIKQFWERFGAQVELRHDGVWTEVDGGVIHDQGDRISIHAETEPTDKQIRLLVQAGRERGWETIRFWGSEDFQYRAREEAIRQGYPPHAITLTCEKNKTATPKPVPEHVRQHQDTPDPVPDDTTPADERKHAHA